MGSGYGIIAKLTAVRAATAALLAEYFTASFSAGLTSRLFFRCVAGWQWRRYRKHRRNYLN
ncbi:hypothetical protein KY359_04795, partial [Candidatus Woesearchaeota archaeon]|nr:hypothetical protein [Candidatus Woesearchaeota archaeon]